MPSPIVRSISLRSFGPTSRGDLGVTAKTAPRSFIERHIGVPSVVIAFRAARIGATDRVARGGEGLSDTSTMPGRLDSLKIKTSSSRLYATSEAGLISENQKDARATTTAVVIAAPRAEALQVTAQWRDE